MAYPVYRFGEFRLDPANRKLWRGDREISLPPKPFNCLVYLVEHHDRAVQRDELIQAVWGDVHLTDRVLAQNVSLIRHALDDNGEEQECIETVRGYGYRWAAPVEVVQPPVETTGPLRRWAPLVILAFGALVAAVLFLRPSADPPADAGPSSPPPTGEIALLLPVTVVAGADHAWVRLGVMDLIAERLRAAGQAMVPSDTVIALLGGLPAELDSNDLGNLTAPTGARLVLAAEAHAAGTRWTVSLHTLAGAQPPLTAVGEAHDVLAAGRAAADRMAVALGLTPDAKPDGDPELRLLLQRVEAAQLAQQMDAARALIEEADPRLRRHPEVRLQSAWLEFRGYRLDTARAGFASLLVEPAVERDPVFRARVLNGLAGVDIERGDPQNAEPILHEAARLLGAERVPDHLGTVQTNLGILAATREDFDAARLHFAQARRIFEGIGDVQRLASLDLNVGVLEARGGRYTESLRYLESAAERRAAVHDVRGELMARAYMIEAHLWLLDPEAASAVEPRLAQLQAQATDPNLVALANVMRVQLLEAMGHWQDADGLLTEVQNAAETGDLAPWLRSAAQMLRSERVMTVEGDFAQAADQAAEVVEGLAGSADLDETRARAWLVLVRARLALGLHAAAAEASTAMTSWAQLGKSRVRKIYAALAEAAPAAADGRSEAAAAAFERAFVLADNPRVPLHLLHVAQSYVPWLLSEGPHGTADPERALFVADRVVGLADRHYEAALLQLRLYHALGPLSAWRTSLARATSLAGERRFPPELLVAPEIEPAMMAEQPAPAHTVNLP